MYPKRLKSKVVCSPDYPLVQLNSGKLCGLEIDGTFVFRGVPYAEAQRFRLPTKICPWEGIKKARCYGAVCPEISTEIAFDAYNVPHYYYPQDENCLFLNIWTQHLNSSAKRPVMVWLHGGGFNTGSSIELFAYDGEELSRYGDAVVVSVNHRLNLLGYLDLSEYGEEYRYSGNCGSADLVAALQWIHENISVFGGDPSCVTIMGQSGGGGKVAALLQTPSADGLYHRAIIQSGVIPDRNDITQEQAKEFTRRLVKQLGLKDHIPQELSKIPYEELASAAVHVCGSSRIPFGPVVDGEFYFGSGMRYGFRQETADIPVLIGSVLGEFSNNFNYPLLDGNKNKWDDTIIQHLAEEKYGNLASQILSSFGVAYPNRSHSDVLFLDCVFRRGVYLYAKERAMCCKASIYSFLFSLECPVDGGSLPWHNAEEAYMFHNAKYIEASYIPGVSEKLQDQMSRAWINFAQYGNPNCSCLPEWKSEQESSGETMLFDRDCSSVSQHDRTLIELISLAAQEKPRTFMPANLQSGGGPRQRL